jgi:hypothetical protein
MYPLQSHVQRQAHPEKGQLTYYQICLQRSGEEFEVTLEDTKVQGYMAKALKSRASKQDYLSPRS